MVATAGPLIAAGDGLAKLVSGLVLGVALTLVVFAGADPADGAMMILPQGGTDARSDRGARSACSWRRSSPTSSVPSQFAALIVASGRAARKRRCRSDAFRHARGQGIRRARRASSSAASSATCSWCPAIRMCARVRSDVAKIPLIFAAILAFTPSGFEHVAANMTTYGVGLFSRTRTPPGRCSARTCSGRPRQPFFVGGALIVGVGYWVIGGSPRMPRTDAHASAAHVRAGVAEPAPVD